MSERVTQTIKLIGGGQGLVSTRVALIARAGSSSAGNECFGLLAEGFAESKRRAAEENPCCRGCGGGRLTVWPEAAGARSVSPGPFGPKEDKRCLP